MRDLTGFSRKWYCKSCQSEVGSDEFCHVCMSSLWVIEITSEIQEKIIQSPISFERSSESINRNSGIYWWPYWPINFEKSSKSRNNNSIKPKQSQKCICKICNEKLGSNQALEIHIKAKHPCLCPYCSKLFKTEIGCNQHIKDAHPESFDEDIHKLYFICKKCGNKYTSQKKLERHLKKCHIDEK